MKKKIILSITIIIALILTVFIIKTSIFLKKSNDEVPIIKYLKPLPLKEKVIVGYNYIKIMNRRREKAYIDLGKLITENPNVAVYNYLLGFGGYNFIGNPECFTDAIKLIPNDSNLYYQRGIAYQNFAFFKNAISDFDKALELDPNNPKIYIKRAEAKIAINKFRTTVMFNNSFRKQDLFDYEGALEDTKKAIELDKTNEYLLYEFYGDKARIEGNYKSAEENYTKAIKLNKKTDSSYRKRALNFFYSQNDKNAISDLIKASKIDKDNVLNYVDMADIQKNYLMDYKSAIKSYDKVIKLEGEQAEFFQKRAECKFDLKKFKDAIKDFNKALKLDPNNPTIYYSRGRTKSELGDFKGAIPDLDKAIELNPKYEWAYNERGNMKFLTQDYKGAIEDLSKAVELDPKDAKAYEGRGSSKFELKDYKGAIKDFNKAIELNPNHQCEEMLTRRALAKEKLEDYQGALSDINKVIESNPKSYIAYEIKGEILFSDGKFKDSILACKKSLELNPTDEYKISNYFVLSMSKKNLEDNEGALESLNQLEKIATKNRWLDEAYTFIYYPKGIVKYDMKDYKGALEDLNKALKFDPENKEIKEKIEEIKEKL